MSSRFKAETDRFFVERDAHLVFDTDRPSVNLLSDEAIISVTGQVISFPNLIYGDAYLNTRSGDISKCESWSVMLPQEWGPNYADSNPATQFQRFYRNLPATLLGTVPEGTDYLDVRVKLTRTSLGPSMIRRINQPIPMLKQGEWVNCPGGGCPLEYVQPMARMIDFVLDGTNVYLRRFQSVFGPGSYVNFGSYGWDFGDVHNAWSSASAYQNGVAISGAVADISRIGSLGTLIDERGPNGTGNKLRTGASATNTCTRVAAAPPNYASTWTGDIVIHPGRISDRS